MYVCKTQKSKLHTYINKKLLFNNPLKTKMYVCKSGKTQLHTYINEKKHF